MEDTQYQDQAGMFKSWYQNNTGLYELLIMCIKYEWPPQQKLQVWVNSKGT
jgi:hypothetical protein